jgi:hypothetical protein
MAVRQALQGLAASLEKRGAVGKRRWLAPPNLKVSLTLFWSVGFSAYLYWSKGRPDLRGLQQ